MNGITFLLPSSFLFLLLDEIWSKLSWSIIIIIIPQSDKEFKMYPINSVVFDKILSPISHSLTILYSSKNCHFRKTFSKSRVQLSSLSKNNRINIFGLKSWWKPL